MRAAVADTAMLSSAQQRHVQCDGDSSTEVAGVGGLRQAGGICLGAGSQGLNGAEQGPQGDLGSEAHQLCRAHP